MHVLTDPVCSQQSREDPGRIGKRRYVERKPETIRKQTDIKKPIISRT